MARMPVVTTPTKTASSGGLMTRRRITNSGRLMAVTAIMKARVVPRGRPLPSSAWTIGMVPAAFEYIGTASRTTSGTASRLARPPIWATRSVGA